MSSHREAPEISKDPSADNTDVYAFVCPDKPETACLIANFLPFELPYGGPNFNEFADDVLYEIKISNHGDAKADIIYQFRFHTKVRNPHTFLYNVGPISSPTDKNWNRPQTYSVTRLLRRRDGHSGSRRGPGHAVSAARRSTSACAARRTIRHWPRRPTTSCSAGPRCSPASAPTASTSTSAASSTSATCARSRVPTTRASRRSSANMPGVNGLTRPQRAHDRPAGADQPTSPSTASRPRDVMSPKSVIGVWATASRTTARILDHRAGTYRNFGHDTQISRLGNPLVNEVINPMASRTTGTPSTARRQAVRAVRPASRARRR